MKVKTLVFLIYLFSISGLVKIFANPVISNIGISLNQSAGTITISYSIEGITNTAEIKAQASIDGGISYSVPLSNATGSIGSGITNGSGKSIVWQAGKDLPNGGPFEMRIKLDAFENSISLIDEEYPPKDFNISSEYKLPKTGCTWNSPHLPYDDGELQIGREFSFTDNGDGTVTDNNTGLMWIQDLNVGRNNGDYFDAPDAVQEFVDNLEFAGYSDWRLPSKRELCFVMNVTEEPMLVFDPRYFQNINYHPIFYKESSQYWIFRTYNPYHIAMGYYDYARWRQEGNGQVFPVSNFYQWDNKSSFGAFKNISLPTIKNTGAYIDLGTDASPIFPQNIGSYDVKHLSYNFKNYFNILIVRGSDQTLPNISQAGELLYNDSNNQLTYKVIKLNNQLWQDFLKNGLKMNDSFNNPINNFDFILHSIKEQISSEGFRLANLNECLNLTTSIDLKSALTSTLSPSQRIGYDPCHGKQVYDQDICNKGFYILRKISEIRSYRDENNIYHHNGLTFSAMFIDYNYEDFIENIILVKNL